MSADARVMYKVTIERFSWVPATQREYVRVADTGGKDGGAQYGYVEKPGWEKLTRTLLVQETDTLDLSAVIKAVNGL